MKKLLSLVATLILFAVLANGCVLSDEEPEQPEEISADAVLDDELFQDAISTKDLPKCDEILNGTKREECKDAVESLQVTDAAVAALDESLCEDISLERYKENCENKVQEKIAEINAEKAREEKEEKRVGITQKAFDMRDPSICDEIEDENQKKTCRFNVIVQKAKEEKDLSLCEEINHEESIKDCKEIVEGEET